MREWLRELEELQRERPDLWRLIPRGWMKGVPEKESGQILSMLCLFISAEDDLQIETTKAASTLDAIARDRVECDVMLTGTAAA